MIGQTISQYRIIEQLGEGGMGVVYLAEDLTLGRRVALKFLSTTTKDYRARFLREVRAVSALSHPNIATVYNYGETDAGMVQQVGRRYWRRHGYPYAYGYGYRPYGYYGGYRPYGYYRPYAYYGGPYGYYGGPYGYYGRPGISFSFGF